jgi:hypothetical protein
VIFVGNLPGDIREREVEDIFYKVVLLTHLRRSVCCVPLGVAGRMSESIVLLMTTFCRQFGRIKTIDLKVPPRPPAFCFVEFEDARQAFDVVVRVSHEVGTSLFQKEGARRSVFQCALNATVLGQSITPPPVLHIVSWPWFLPSPKASWHAWTLSTLSSHACLDVAPATREAPPRDCTVFSEFRPQRTPGGRAVGGALG